MHGVAISGIPGFAVTPSVTNYDANQCPWCHMNHTGVCSLIKSIEYHQDGTIKRVEFK